MRTTLAGALLVVGACAADEPDAPRPTANAELARTLERYASDPALRARVLESSLVRTDNAYARVRLARYGSTWASLPELNPSSTPIHVEDVDRGAPASEAVWRSLDLDAGWSLPELAALGEAAFYAYPVEVVTTIPKALGASDRAGIWRHDGELGAVWTKLADGRVVPAFTCATCHATVEQGKLVAGKNNADLDLGRLHGDGDRGFAWRRGTVDVTGDGVEDPVAIPDLRPIRFQQNLHHAATVRNDPVALAIRIETLIITSHGQAVRPPRKIVAGLAAFLLGLAPARTVPSETRGAAVFARTCAGCHRGEATSGPAVPLATVGTDPRVGESRERGTGKYRVPSLRAVGDRRRLFASGAIEEVEELLTDTPERATKGHLFGLGLSPEDRAALLEHLRAL